MPDSIVPGAREFHTTRWSVVLAARHGSEAAARDALATLCRDYWYPLYAFVRMRGYSAHDAQDLTQAFLADLLARSFQPDPAQGRFRSYLLGALKHFLANEWHRGRAQKRGGSQAVIEWDALDAESRYALEPVDQNDPDTMYDQKWATELLGRAMAKLRSEFEQKGEGETFALLKTCLSGGEGPRGECPRAL
jgi:DNA-directed RNA polymerase specialized sigma24 family protein